MHFTHIYDDDLAQGSYLLGSESTGEAIVVDPRRDVEVYLDEAAKAGLRIVAVTETHIHADYLSGARELAHATGARLHLSDEGDADWKYGFEGAPLRHDDVIDVGDVRLRAIHTPGHTPEHLCFLVVDRATSDEGVMLLTGDFVFVGDVGRPDLLDEAAGGVDTRFEGARQLFASLRDRFLTLPDHLQIWPGHGAGSACGKQLGAVPSSTVGYERRTAWWVPSVERGDRDAFVDALLGGQPDAPAYFGRMKRQNRAGPAILGELRALERFGAEDVVDGAYLLIDARPTGEGVIAAARGALAIPAGRRFATYASYVVDPERDDRPIVLLGPDRERADALRAKLLGIGVDGTVGYVDDLTSLERRPLAGVAPGGLDALDDPFVLDVRTRSEWAAGRVPGATRLHAGRVMWHLDEIPRDRPVVTYCQSGARSRVVASALLAAGYDDVRELRGSFDAWLRDRPTRVERADRSATDADATA